MTSSLEITKKIYQALSLDDNIVKIVGQNIFPLIAESNTEYPFIVYKRMSINPTYTKDWLTYEDVDVEIVCVSDKYFQAVELASEVRDLFEGIKGDGILQTKLSYVNEDFISDAYIQRLGFSFRMTVK